MGFCIRGHASDAAFFGTAATAGPRRKGVFKGDEAPKCISVLLHASKDMLFMFGCLEAARFLVHAVRYEWLFPQWAGFSVIVRAKAQLTEKRYSYTVRDMQKPGRAIIEARARRQA